MWERLDTWILVLTLGVMGYLWVRDLGKPKTVIIRRRSLAPAGAHGAPTSRNAPDTHPATARTDGAPPPAYQRSAAGASETIELNTPRERTAYAVRFALPSRAPVPPVTAPGTISLIWDGQQWHDLQIGGDGHWGIFGSTGSGKGNTLQYIALNALRCGPDMVRLIVLDPKGGLDYAFCNRLQHATLYHGAELSAGYAAVVAEMERRHALMLGVEARKLSEYIQRTGDQLPKLVVIADEVAELDKDQRAMLGTIARMGRAAGIVLLVATQYPTVDALSNQVQANLDNRLVLRLNSASYTPVALRRTKEDGGQFEPAAIPRAGVGVLRRDGGREMLGVVPEVDDVTRDHQITVLALQWGAVSSVSAPVAVTDNALLQQLCAQLDRGVPPVLAKKTDDLALGTPGTGGAEQPEPPAAPTQPATDDEAEIIRYCLTQDWSGNRIAKALGGNRQARYDQIRQIKAAMGGDDE